MFDARAKTLLCGLLLLFFCLSVHTAHRMSMTTDEWGFYTYGRQILFEGKTSRQDPIQNFNSKLPTSALNAAPEWFFRRVRVWPIRAFTERFLLTDPGRFYFLGRIMTILVSLGLAAAVFLWSRELHGSAGGVFALALYVTSPNVLAHSSLITSDLYAAASMFTAAYFFWRLLRHPGRGNFWLAAAALGVAQLCKYTAVHLLPIFLLLLAAEAAPRVRQRISRREFRPLGKSALRMAARGAAFLAAAGLVIWAGFLFRGLFVPLHDYPMKSASMIHLQAALPNLRVPLPFAYLEGLDWVKYGDETRQYFNLYFLGELQTDLKPGWWDYFLVAFLLKTTLGLMALLALAAYLAARGRGPAFRDQMYLLLPVVYLLMSFSFFARPNIGLRYLLPIYPFLFVFAGGVARQAGAFRKAGCVLLLAHALSSLSYHPHYIAYFNETIGRRVNMYRYLAHSNVDWGQGQNYLLEYFNRTRDPYMLVNPRRVRPGRMVIGVNRLVGVYDSEQYRWVRENLTPVGHVAYCFLIFDVPANVEIPIPPRAPAQLGERNPQEK